MVIPMTNFTNTVLLKYNKLFVSSNPTGKNNVVRQDIFVVTRIRTQNLYFVCEFVTPSIKRRIIQKNT